MMKVYAMMLNAVQRLQGEFRVCEEIRLLSMGGGSFSDKRYSDMPLRYSDN